MSALVEVKPAVQGVSLESQVERKRIGPWDYGVTLEPSRPLLEGIKFYRDYRMAADPAAVVLHRRSPETP